VLIDPAGIVRLHHVGPGQPTGPPLQRFCTVSAVKRRRSPSPPFFLPPNIAKAARGHVGLGKLLALRISGCDLDFR